VICHRHFWVDNGGPLGEARAIDSPIDRQPPASAGSIPTGDRRKRRRVEAGWSRAAAGVLAVLLASCSAPPGDLITPVPSTPRQVAEQTPERTLAVAVAKSSPTPTPDLVGEYRELVLPRLQRIQTALNHIEQQLTIVQKSPAKMVQDDWRREVLATVDELAAANSDLRALGARTGADAALSADLQKLITNLDFVIDEYRLAFDFDPDGSHLVRAGRAEKAASDQVESILLMFRRPAIGVPPTPSR
jgi:hypothetical protein